MHNKGTESSGKGEATVGAAETFHRQRVEDMLGSSKKKAELQEYRQRARKTSLHGFYYRHVFREK